MSAPVKRRPAVVVPNNSSRSSRESCLRRELEQLSAEVHKAMFGLGHEYYEQCSPGRSNDWKQPNNEYLKNVVSLFEISVKLLKGVNSLIGWNADVMAGKARP